MNNKNFVWMNRVKNIEGGFTPIAIESGTFI